MADRSYIPPLGYLEVGVVKLYASMTFGATGSVTLSSSASKGMASVAKTATGKYTLTLSDKYNSLLHASYNLIDSTLSDPATVGVYMNTFSSGVSSSTPTVVFSTCTSDDGAAADPHEGAVVTVELTLKNSTV